MSHALGSASFQQRSASKSPSAQSRVRSVLPAATLPIKHSIPSSNGSEIIPNGTEAHSGHASTHSDSAGAYDLRGMPSPAEIAAAVRPYTADVSPSQPAPQAPQTSPAPARKPALELPSSKASPVKPLDLLAMVGEAISKISNTPPSAAARDNRVSLEEAVAAQEADVASTLLVQQPMSTARISESASTGRKYSVSSLVSASNSVSNYTGLGTSGKSVFDADRPTPASIAATAANLAAQLREAQTNRLQLQQQLSALRNENIKLKNDSMQAHALLAELRGSSDVDSAEVAKHFKRIRDQEAEITTALAAAAEAKLVHDKTASAMQATIDRLQAEKSQSEAVNRRLEVALERLQDKLTHMEMEKTTMSRHTSEIADQNTQYARLVFDLRGRMSELQAHNDALLLQQETRDVDHTSQIKTLQGKITVYEQQVASLRSLVQDLQQRLNASEATISSVSVEWERKLAAAVDKARTETNAAWEPRLSDMRRIADETLQQSTTNYEEALSKVSQDYEANVVTLKDEIQRITSDRDSLQANVETITKELADTVNTYNERVETLTQKLQNTQSELIDSTNNSANLKKANAALKADAEKLQKRVDDMVSELQRTKTQLVSKDAEILHTEREMQSCNEKVDALLEALDLERRRRGTAESDLKLALHRLQKSGISTPETHSLVRGLSEAELPSTRSFRVKHAVSGSLLGPSKRESSSNDLLAMKHVTSSHELLSLQRAERHSLHRRKSRGASSSKWQNTLRSEPQVAEWVTSVFESARMNDAKTVVSDSSAYSPAVKHSPTATVTPAEPPPLFGIPEPAAAPTETVSQTNKLKAALKASFAAVKTLTDEKKAGGEKIAELNGRLRDAIAALAAQRKDSDIAVNQRQLLLKLVQDMKADGVEFWRRLLALVRVLGARLQSCGEDTEVDPSIIALPASFRTEIPKTILHAVAVAARSASAVEAQYPVHGRRSSSATSVRTRTTARNAAGSPVTQEVRKDRRGSDVGEDTVVFKKHGVRENAPQVVSLLRDNPASPAPVERTDWRHGQEEFAEESFRQQFLVELQSAGLSAREFAELSRGMTAEQRHPAHPNSHESDGAIPSTVENDGVVPSTDDNDDAVRSKVEGDAHVTVRTDQLISQTYSSSIESPSEELLRNSDEYEY